MYTFKRLDEECTAIYKLMKVMGSNAFAHALCEEAQVARLQTYLHKSLDSSANKSKIYQTYVHHNIRTR